MIDPFHENGPCNCESQKHLVEMYAYIFVEDDNTEGIPAFRSIGGPVPMVGADRERMDSLGGIALQLAVARNRKIELVRFSAREHVLWVG